MRTVLFSSRLANNTRPPVIVYFVGDTCTPTNFYTPQHRNESFRSEQQSPFIPALPPLEEAIQHPAIYSAVEHPAKQRILRRTGTKL